MQLNRFCVCVLAPSRDCDFSSRQWWGLQLGDRFCGNPASRPFLPAYNGARGTTERGLGRRNK